MMLNHSTMKQQGENFKNLIYVCADIYSWPQLTNSNQPKLSWSVWVHGLVLQSPIHPPARLSTHVKHVNLH